METLTIPANKKQKQLIHLNVPKPIKEEMIGWATGNAADISCNALTFDQANKILEKFKVKPVELDMWAHFDKNNARHRYVLSLCIQYGWSTRGRVAMFADLKKLNEWMHTNLCPVQKPLMEMDNEDLDKFIGALESMTKKRYQPKKSKLC